MTAIDRLFPNPQLEPGQGFGAIPLRQASCRQPATLIVAEKLGRRLGLLEKPVLTFIRNLMGQAY